MTKEQLMKIIKDSLNELYRNDVLLIENKVKEECINHKLACYIESNIKTNGIFIVNVDVEYNKNYQEPKKIISDNNLRSIRPDIIVHCRNTNTKNYIAIEAKKEYSNKKDKRNIKGLLNSPYNYKWGCIISYLPGKQYFRLKIYSSEVNSEVFNIAKKHITQA